jgi:hypothetical protein
MLLRQRHWLLRLMSMRAVVNGTSLYELNATEPVLIPFEQPHATITLTNGFHASAPLQLPYEAGSTYFFQVNGAIGNTASLAIAIVSICLFAAYALNGSAILLAAANLPVLALLWVFFLQPRQAIVLKPWQPGAMTGG